MPKIAPQHAADAWRPLLAWPDDCYVQWGRGGLVLVEGGESYTTAFFEAFPGKGEGGGGFIRGEGKALEEAEAAAHAELARHRGCHMSGGHAWTRARRRAGHEARLRKGRPVPKVQTYTNGGTFCLRCGAFESTMQPVHVLGSWRGPMRPMELDLLMSGSLRPDEAWEARRPEAERKASAAHRRLLGLRARLHGIAMPDPGLPEHRRAEGASPFSEDAYGAACREAVARWHLDRRRREPPGSSGDGIAGMFDGFAMRHLDREADALAARDAAARSGADAEAGSGETVRA